MTGEKRTETRMRCYNTYISLHDPLYTVIYNACREGWSDIEGIHSVIASHSCFCSFFTSHPYILSKYPWYLQNVFLFTSLYPFSVPT